MDIQKLRRGRGLTQMQLAQRLGVDRSTVAKWEAGGCLPRSDRLMPLAKTLGCTPDELLRSLRRGGA